MFRVIYPQNRCSIQAYKTQHGSFLFLLKFLSHFLERLNLFVLQNDYSCFLSEFLSLLRYTAASVCITVPWQLRSRKINGINIPLYIMILYARVGKEDFRVSWFCHERYDLSCNWYANVLFCAREMFKAELNPVNPRGFWCWIKFSMFQSFDPPMSDHQCMTILNSHFWWFVCFVFVYRTT